MAKRKLKTVGNQRIYLPGLLSNIDPVWLPGRVPNGFWHKKENRRNYLLWLSRRLGFAVMKDWYQLRMAHFLDNRGSGVLQIHWHSSPSKAVKDTFPQYDWCEWLFAKVPEGFWQVRENRVRYMLWLGQQLDFHTQEDWLLLRHEDIEANYGPRILSEFDSIIDLLHDVFPGKDWDTKRILPLNEQQILIWADEYYADHGKWPTTNSGPIATTRETWAGVDLALRRGNRGFSSGGSLPKLLEIHRGKINHLNRPNLTAEQILTWADAHYATHGLWPVEESGEIEETDESWKNISSCLQQGCRGLPGGSSLAKLLEAHRGKQNHLNRPTLTEEQVLAWADEYYAEHDRWPRENAERINGTEEIWMNISDALRQGKRGLPGGSSLARLLESYRGVTNRLNRPKLTEEQILKWADAYFKKHGRWPSASSGKIEGTHENWLNINKYLHQGIRGLSGGSSLVLLLQQRRGHIHPAIKPALTEKQILVWADVYHAKHGRWPTVLSGEIEDMEETWNAISAALTNGSRGLPGGSSLAKLLEVHRGKRNHLNRPNLTEEQILEWADAYYAKHGRWPRENAGRIDGTEETWNNISQCLRQGIRGLAGGSSLAQLLARFRGYRHWNNSPRLSEDEILRWADAYRVQHERWPNESSGQVSGTEENWKNVSLSLCNGLRGLSGGSSLAKLLEQHRDYRSPRNKPHLTEDQILVWADACHIEHGRWPTRDSGSVDGKEETWSGIDLALRRGSRGLPGGSSLAQLLEDHCRKRNHLNRPNLTEEQILAWADAYYNEHDRWPSEIAGQIAGTEENWKNISSLLRKGNRGLPGGSSLAKLLDANRLRQKSS